MAGGGSGGPANMRCALAIENEEVTGLWVKNGPDPFFSQTPVCTE